MKRKIRSIGLWMLVALAFGPSVSQASPYPIAPYGSIVSLRPTDFLQYSPDCQQCNDPIGDRGVVGDNLNRHPGAVIPDPGDSFIGVFRYTLDIGLEDAAVYLWESTNGTGPPSFYGPGVQLGFWDGLEFLPFGIQVQAHYGNTSAFQINEDPNLVTHQINSSVTLLSDFGIVGNPMLNAVRITAIEGGHNQVIAVAAVTPEPSGWTLSVTALLAAVLFTPGRTRRSQAVRRR